MIIVSPKEFRANIHRYCTIAEKESVFISRPNGKLFLLSSVRDKDVPFFIKCCGMKQDEISEDLVPVSREKLSFYVDPFVAKGIEIVSSEEGVSPEEWLSTIAEIRILNGSGYCNMKDFIQSYSQEEEDSQLYIGNSDCLLKNSYMTSELKSCIRSLMKADVSILKLSNRIINSLRQAKINDVGNLCCFSNYELKNIRGLGNESIKAICFALKEKGIELGDGLAQEFGYPIHK